MYHNVEKRSNYLTRISLKLMVTAYVRLLALLVLLSVLYNIYRGQLDTEKWFTIAKIA